MHSYMLVLALSVIFKPDASMPIKDGHFGDLTVNSINHNLKTAYSKINFWKKSEMILILGDVDGNSSELSNFLRSSKNKTAKHADFYKFPSFDVDRRTGTLIVDLPAFIDERNVSTILTSAFVNKIIFDRAKRIKILLSMPRNHQKASKLMVEVAAKLAEMNLGHFNAFTKSIGVIGTRGKKENSRFRLEELKHVLEEAVSYMIEREIPGVDIITQVIHQKDIAIINQGSNLKTLREFVFDTLEFSRIRTKTKIDVNTDTVKYVKLKFHLFVNKPSFDMPTFNVINEVIKYDCGDECRGEGATFKWESKCCRAWLWAFQKMPEKDFRDYIGMMSQWNPILWSEIDFELQKAAFFGKIIDPNYIFRFKSCVWERLQL